MVFTELADEESFMYIESKRSRNPLLLYSGYTYSLKKYKTTKDSCQKKLWRCSTHTNRGCQAGLITYMDTIISIKSHHNHERPTYTYHQ